MNKENIKNELISEVEKLLNLSENKIGGSSGMGKLKAMAEHMGKADAFSHKIVDLLNEILVKNNGEFKEKESCVELPVGKNFEVEFAVEINQ